VSWLIWRHHRLAGLSALVLLIVVAVPLVLSGLTLRSGYDQLGIAACAGHTDPRCIDLLSQYSDQYRGWGQQLLPWLNFVPGLLGALVGAPLLARELEQRTHLLAWTQSVTRRRWLIVKLAALVLAIGLLGAAFTALITWWRWPLDQLEGHFVPNTYDFEGLIPTAYAVFAFGLGAFLGVLLRRTVAAMGATMVTFFAIRYALVEVLLRPRFQPPLQAIVSPGPNATRQEIVGGTGFWTVDSGLQDGGGRHLSDGEIQRLVREALDAGLNPGVWFQQHGYLRWVLYQPADRYWTFQSIEAALFAILSVGLLAATVWLVHRVT
jgi:hypothetical protein